MVEWKFQWKSAVKKERREEKVQLSVFKLLIALIIHFVNEFYGFALDVTQAQTYWLINFPSFSLFHLLSKRETFQRLFQGIEEEKRKKINLSSVERSFSSSPFIINSNTFYFSPPVYTLFLIFMARLPFLWFSFRLVFCFVFIKSTFKQELF